MFETSGSWVSQEHPPLGLSAFRSRMISPVNIRQPEVLPASANPCRVSSNLDFNECGNPGWLEKGLANDGIGSIGNSTLYSPPTLYAPSLSPSKQIYPFLAGEKPRTYEEPCPEQRKFLVFDQSGNETRLMFSALCPGVQNMPVIPTMCPVWNPQVGSIKQFDARKFLLERQARKDEQVFTKTPIMSEESGENEILDEECEMREDTDEINALLYSDDDDDDDGDNDYDDDNDEEVSSGRSPLAREGVRNKQEEQQKSYFDNDEAISSICSKRHKTLDGGHEKLGLMNNLKTEKQNFGSEKIHSGDFTSALDEGTLPEVGSKRPRKDKLCDTLKVLESLLPGLKNKDPVSILDEAISYLKCLKYNAQSMSMEDSENSGCYESLH